MIPSDADSVRRGERRQSIVQSLLTDVLRGEYRPCEHLVTQRLADRFGVSHTPIREALIELAGMGVVELLPNRGAAVRRVSRRDVMEIAQVRRLLECNAVRRSCGRIALGELDALRRDLLELQQGRGRQMRRFVEKARAVDNRLHDVIADGCGNGFLAQELNRLKLLFRVFRDVAWEREEARNDPQRIAEETGEHLAIVNALRDHDAKAAAKAMSEHIRKGTRYWSRSVAGSKSGLTTGIA